MTGPRCAPGVPRLGPICTDFWRADLAGANGRGHSQHVSHRQNPPIPRPSPGLTLVKVLIMSLPASGTVPRGCAVSVRVGKVAPPPQTGDPAHTSGHSNAITAGGPRGCQTAILAVKPRSRAAVPRLCELGIVPRAPQGVCGASRHPFRPPPTLLKFSTFLSLWWAGGLSQRCRAGGPGERQRRTAASEV